MRDNNYVELIGRTKSEMNFSHEINGEKFFELQMVVSRVSGVDDIINLMISDRIIFICEDILDKTIYVNGTIRTYNRKEHGKNHVKVYMLVDELDVIDEEVGHMNEVYLDGFLVKISDIRETPLSNRKIVDAIVAINMDYGRSEYVPLVIWNKLAKQASYMHIGDRIKITGRFQSRNYQKNDKEMTAYEISVNGIKKIE